MIVIGTAGHIDHGKTTLCARITGVQTDRLKEEQERGISIELGFAFFDLPGGMRCGVIDVPGHEKFVRQMIAGAVGVDLVMLVVAADEGVMPQTREHLDICRLLGVRRGVVVITKTDLVDEDWLALVKEDVAQFVAGTFLEGQPMLSFSATDEEAAGEFISQFHAFIEEQFPTPPQRDPSRPFKMSIDRAFTMKGFGTVVTGTVGSGTVHVGDEILISPSMLSSRIRGIQVHGDKVENVMAGSRAAINLQGLEKQEVGRGDVMVRREELEPTSMFDGSLLLLSNLEKPLSQRAKVLVHTGTVQLLGTVVLLDTDILLPGEESLIQIRLEQPTIVLPGESYVLRGFEVLANYGKTLGGGQILDPRPVKHKRRDEEATSALVSIRDGGDVDGVLAIVRLCGVDGADLGSLRRRCAISLNVLTEILKEEEASGHLVRVEAEETLFFHKDAFGLLREKAIAETEAYHSAHPERPGIPREELRGAIRHDFDPRVCQHLFQQLTDEGELETDGESICRGDFSVNLSPTLKAGCDTLREIYTRAGLQPPTLTELAEQTSLSPADLKTVMDILIREEALVRVRGDLCFDKNALGRLQTELVSFLEKEGEITTPQFKELVGASRKFTIPLGEYFDSLKLTLRVGDNTRRLR